MSGLWMDLAFGGGDQCTCFRRPSIHSESEDRGGEESDERRTAPRETDGRDQGVGRGGAAAPRARQADVMRGTGRVEGAWGTRGRGRKRDEAQRRREARKRKRGERERDAS